VRDVEDEVQSLVAGNKSSEQRRNGNLCWTHLSHRSWARFSDSQPRLLPKPRGLGDRCRTWSTSRVLVQSTRLWQFPFGRVHFGTEACNHLFIINTPKAALTTPTLSDAFMAWMAPENLLSTDAQIQNLRGINYCCLFFFFFFFLQE